MYSLLYLRLDQCVIYLIERAWWEGRKARRKQQTPFFSFFSRRRDFEKCLFSSSERRESCTKTRIVCIYKGPSKFPFYISPLLSFGGMCTTQITPCLLASSPLSHDLIFLKGNLREFFMKKPKSNSTALITSFEMYRNIFSSSD